MMPKSSQQQQSLYCQQAGDFTVVTPKSDINKENLGQARNYQTINQSVAQERLQLLRIVELENKIFTQAFTLIENFYRPSNVKNDTGEETKSVHSKRKRHAKNETKVVLEEASVSSDGAESRPHLGVPSMPLPRKRIHGLCKAYKAEYSAKMAQPGISKRFGDFHRELVDWQLVFAPATDFPTSGTNLAKELNFDSLFDYEDAIATTANLLAIARQHSDLMDGLVLCADSTSKSFITQYIPDQTNQGCSDEFRELVVLVEQLIKLKQERAAQLIQRESCQESQSGHLLGNWFKCDKSICCSKSTKECLASTHLGAKSLLKEISAWEELTDMVEITK